MFTITAGGSRADVFAHCTLGAGAGMGAAAACIHGSTERVTLWRIAYVDTRLNDLS